MIYLSIQSTPRPSYTETPYVRTLNPLSHFFACFSLLFFLLSQISLSIILLLSTDVWLHVQIRKIF